MYSVSSLYLTCAWMYFVWGFILLYVHRPYTIVLMPYTHRICVIFIMIQWQPKKKNITCRDSIFDFIYSKNLTGKQPQCMSLKVLKFNIWFLIEIERYLFLTTILSLSQSLTRSNFVTEIIKVLGDGARISSTCSYSQTSNLDSITPAVSKWSEEQLLSKTIKNKYKLKLQPMLVTAIRSNRSKINSITFLSSGLLHAYPFLWVWCVREFAELSVMSKVLNIQ